MHGIFLVCISDLIIVVYISQKEKKKDCFAIFHSSPNLDIASRNQIRKYATGTAVTGDIQFRLCLRAYWPPLEFPRMPRIRPRLFLFAYTSPHLSSVCTTLPPARASLREIFSAEFLPVDQKLFRHGTTFALSRVIFLVKK